jgi:predicted GNAT family acetyltransferase
MQLEVTHRPTTSEFVIERDGREVAHMKYARHGQRVDILHTEVDRSLRGEGAGAKLVAAAVDWARREHLHIVPLCPFANAVMAKTPDYSDVLMPR